MVGKRLLVIDKLIVAVPDEIASMDGREELTIDAMLEWLLRYRKTADAVTKNNRYGNFLYFASDLPKGANPENPDEVSLQTLLNYLVDSDSSKRVAGMMYSLIYDEELGSFRNAYPEDDDEEFQKTKQAILDARHAAEEFRMRSESEHDEDDDEEMVPSCPECDNICSERCPDEEAVGQEDGDDE